MHKNDADIANKPNRERDARRKFRADLTIRKNEALRALSAELTKLGVENKLDTEFFSIFSPKFGTLAQAQDIWSKKFEVWTKFTLNIRSCSEDRKFPERKKGFDFAAIATMILAECQIIAEQQAQSLALRQLRQDVLDTFGEIDGVSLKTRQEGLEIHLKGLSEDQVFQVMHALRAILE